MTKIHMPDYDILIQEGLFKDIQAHIPKTYHDKHLFILTDANVQSLYQKAIDLAFEHLTYDIIAITPGETSKSLLNYEILIKKLLDLGIKRDDLIIALGGGVVGDLAGFVASTLYRGIDLIQVPTTLLAIVDSSIGGKTGVNLDVGKNLLGTFYAPKSVLIDPRFLETLEPIEYQNGVAEMIKAGLIGDPELFESLKAHHQVTEIDIERAILVKKEIVSKDPFDRGERMVLNFGHTFGHAIELKTNYETKHGIAISYGMLIALQIGIDLGITPASLYQEVYEMLIQRQLISEPILTKDELLPYIRFDKKHDTTGLRFILIKMVGTPLIMHLKPGEI